MAFSIVYGVRLAGDRSALANAFELDVDHVKGAYRYPVMTWRGEPEVVVGVRIMTCRAGVVVTPALYSEPFREVKKLWLRAVAREPRLGAWIATVHILS